uniref:Uncharacterized protein n=1 Tax=Gibberella zeae (strain ATCC MYA-4620 / CBS 123657 / FGSC 9075 / NRRL 31084 / PH-1) TaxID=229533 RepID=A0A098E4P2_GIBZE
MLLSYYNISPLNLYYIYYNRII